MTWAILERMRAHAPTASALALRVPAAVGGDTPGALKGYSRGTPAAAVGGDAPTLRLYSGVRSHGVRLWGLRRALYVVLSCAALSFPRCTMPYAAHLQLCAVRRVAARRVVVEVVEAVLPRAQQPDEPVGPVEARRRRRIDPRERERAVRDQRGHLPGAGPARAP